MDIFAFVGVGIIMCILIVTVKQFKPELALPLCIISGVVMTGYLINLILPLFNEIKSIAADSGINSDFIVIAVKAIGICIAVQIASDVCRDAGQSALANKLEMGGKIALLIVSLPLFKEMLSLAVEIIGVGA